MADTNQPLPAASPEFAALLAKLGEAEARAEKEAAAHRLTQLRVQQLEETLRLLLLKKYGPSSESLSDVYLNLFEDEPGVTLDEVAAEAAREPIAACRPRKPHPGRQTLPAHLPRKIRTIVCAPSQCTCGQCGAATAIIGYEESERLDIEPAELFVTVTRREKRACAHCKQAGVVTAPVPAPIIEKGLASDRVVIDAVVAKYCDHLPLYRQSAMLLRDAGVDISRVTMNGWVMRVGELLGPIASAMRREVLASPYIQADETTVPVQQHGRKPGKNHQAYLWQFGIPGSNGGRSGPVIFHFAMGRQGEVARKMLGEYAGILQSDGYAGYNHAGGVGMVHAGCWAHARRYCVDALKLHPNNALAAEFVGRMDELFAVDREAREANVTLAMRAELRRERSVKIVAELRARLEAERRRVLPKSKLGEAVHYALAQWERLTRFLEHPVLELSNNLAENSMRPAVLGRKNWVHVGSVEAGPRVAAILSVVETCRRMGLPVREYLGAVLPGLADRKMTEVAELTPGAWRDGVRPSGNRGRRKDGDGRTHTVGLQYHRVVVRIAKGPRGSERP